MTSNRSKGLKRLRTHSPESLDPSPPTFPPAVAPPHSSQSSEPVSIMDKYSSPELILLAQKHGLYVILPILNLSTKYAESCGAQEAPWYLPWMMVLLGFFSFNLDKSSSVIHAMPFPQHPVVAGWDSTEVFLKVELDAATRKLGLSSDVSEQSSVSSDITTKLSKRIPDFVHKLFKFSAMSDTTKMHDQSIKRRRTILIVEIKGVPNPRYMDSLAQNVVDKQCPDQAWHVFQEEPSLRCVACIVGIGHLFYYREYYRDRLAKRSAPTDDGECIPPSPHYSSSDTARSSPSIEEQPTEDEQCCDTPLRAKLYPIFHGERKKPLFLSYLQTDGEEILLDIAKRLKEINEDFWSSSESEDEDDDDEDDNEDDNEDDDEDDDEDDEDDDEDEDEDDEDEDDEGDDGDQDEDDEENVRDFEGSDDTEIHHDRASRHASNSDEAITGPEGSPSDHHAWSPLWPQGGDDYDELREDPHHVSSDSNEEITSREGTPAEVTHHDHHAWSPPQVHAPADEYDELRDDPPEQGTSTGEYWLHNSSELGSPLRVAEDDSSDPLLGPVDP